MSLSLIAVPVFLDTTTEAAHLVYHWARTYHYGHLVLPTMAVGTAGLYAYAAARRRAAKRSWAGVLAAGLTTVAMVPFTWIFMVPTNDKLFGLEIAFRAAQSAAAPAASLGEVRELIVKWSWLHVTRSVFPLAGAVLGLLVTFGKWKS